MVHSVCPPVAGSLCRIAAADLPLVQPQSKYARNVRSRTASLSDHQRRHVRRARSRPCLNERMACGRASERQHCRAAWTPNKGEPVHVTGRLLTSVHPSWKLGSNRDTPPNSRPALGASSRVFRIGRYSALVRRTSDPTVDGRTCRECVCVQAGNLLRDPL